jgi:protein-S-isoprenylcysteine O-methyltransferase Ste14
MLRCLPKLRYSEIMSNAALALMYLLFVYAHLNAYNTDPRLSILLICIFEAIIVALALFRREQKGIMMHWKTVVTTTAGTFLPLLLRPDTTAVDHLAGQMLQIAGISMQVASALSLWRSFGLLPANRGIQTSGMYRIIRHPLYLSYLVAQSGYVINNPTLANFAVLFVATSFQIMRIRYEEQLLLASPLYESYARTVPWRLVPHVW